MPRVVSSALAGARTRTTVLVVEFTYEPDLAGGARGAFGAERQPELHVYVSAGASVVDASDARDVGVVLVDTATLTAGDVVTVYVPLALERPLPADAALWFATWVETATRAGVTDGVVRARAGEAGVYLERVLRARSATAADDDALVEWQTTGVEPVAKGRVRVRRAYLARYVDGVARRLRASLRVDARVPPVFEDHGSSNTALTSAARAAHTALAAEIDGAFRMYERGGLLARSDPPFVRGMHCYAYATAVGDLPDGAFMQHMSRAPSPLGHYEECLRVALLNNDASAADLLAVVEAQRRAPERLLPAMRVVARVLGDTLAVFPNALAYLDDFYVRGHRRRTVGRSTLDFSTALVGRSPTTLREYLDEQIEAGTLEGQVARALLDRYGDALDEAPTKTTYTLFMPSRLTTSVCKLPLESFLVKGVLSASELETPPEFEGIDAERPPSLKRRTVSRRERLFNFTTWPYLVGGVPFDVQRKAAVYTPALAVYRMREVRVTDPRARDPVSGAPLIAEAPTIDEDFKDARMGEAGDCEDVGKEGAAAAVDFARLATDAAVYAAATPFMRTLLELVAPGGPYTPLMPRGVVTQATLNTAVDGLADGDAKFHTFAALAPTAVLAARLAGPHAAATRASALFARVDAFEPWQRELPWLLVEGTARTPSLVRTLDAAYGERADEAATRVRAVRAALAALALPPGVHYEVSPTLERDRDGAVRAQRADVSSFYKALSDTSILAGDVGVWTLAFARERDGALTHGATFTAVAGSDAWPDDVRVVPTAVYTPAARATVAAALDHLEPVPPLTVEGGVQSVFATALAELLPLDDATTRVTPERMPLPPATLVLAVNDAIALDVRPALLAAVRRERARFTAARAHVAYLADPERDEHELGAVAMHYISLRVAM